MTEPEFEQDADGSLWRIIPRDLLDEDFERLRPLFAGSSQGSHVGLRIRVPTGEGYGTIDTVLVREHLYIVRMDAEWHLDQQFFAEKHKAKVRILLSGELRTPDEHIHLKGAGAYLEVYPGDKFTSFIIAGGHRTRLLIVNLWPEFFSEVAGLSSDILPDPLGNLFTHADDSPQTALTPLGPDLLRAANDIMQSDVYQPSGLWKSFLSAKCQEIACSVVRDLSGAGGAHLPQGLTVRDVNRIHEARDILADNFQKPPKVTVLAKKVGINQTKLKSAFKAVFGTTMSEFTMKCRMERAGELLTSTDVSIAEIAYAVGYDHPPNFSNAFRRYFGHTPSELRQAHAVRKIGVTLEADHRH